jgi:hypothetical protein
MGVNRAKYRYLIIYTLVVFITALGSIYVLHTLIPEHYFGAYPLIPVYFFVLGVIHFCLFGLYNKFTPQKKLLFYMAMKIQKLILSIGLFVIYCLVVRVFVLEFAFTFVSFYLVTLSFETIFFYHLEWKSRKYMVK